MSALTTTEPDRAAASGFVVFTPRGEAALDQLATVLTAHCSGTPGGIAKVLEEVMHADMGDLTRALTAIAQASGHRAHPSLDGPGAETRRRPHDADSHAGTRCRRPGKHRPARSAGEASMAVDKAAEREEKLRALQDKLIVGVEQLVTGEDWKRAIEFAARFRSRSFSNTMLIALAHAEAFEKGLVPNPYPTYVAGYRQWQQLGRQVRRGMPGYQIVAPVLARFVSSNPADPTSWYRLPPGEKAGPGEMTRTRMVGVRPTYVWDVSATEGPDIPERPLPVLLKGQSPPGLREGLVAEIEGKGFTVVEVPDAASIFGANGLTDFAAKTVSYRVDVDDSSQVRTLSHELGHLLMHDPASGDWVKHRGIGEVEAESFALMVSAAHQMDSSGYTIPYVASWADSVPGKTPVEVVQATADKVCKTAAQVLARLDTVQVGDGTPEGPAAAGRGVEEVRGRVVPDAARVAEAMPPTPTPPVPVDPWSTKVGDRFLRDGQIWEAVRITPAGANGTSRMDGPTIHAKIVREPGSLSDYTADIWSKSMSNPASAYTRLKSPVDVSQSTVTGGDALPDVGEAIDVTTQAHDRLDRLHHGGAAQPPGGARSLAARPVVGPGM